MHSIKWSVTKKQFCLIFFSFCPLTSLVFHFQVKLYANKNVGLAEASQALVRNVNYEIPGIKKQIAKLEQTQTVRDRMRACV